MKDLKKFIATTIREYLNENVNTIETLEQTSKRMFNKSVSELSDDEYYQASDENAKMRKIDITDILPKIKQNANKNPDFLNLSMENLEYIKSFYDGDGGYHESGTNNIKIGSKNIDSEHTFYIQGVEPDSERDGRGSHTVESSQGDAIYYHELGHKMFSENPTIGHKILNNIKQYSKTEEFGHPTEYSVIADDLFDATMMDFYSFYKLHPNILKKSQPKMFLLMKEWEIEFISYMYGKFKKNADNNKFTKFIEVFI